MTYSTHHDLLTAIGFLVVLQACRRLRKHGHLWMGIPCNTFVWLSRGWARLTWQYIYIYIYAVYESGGSGVTFVSPGSTGRSRLQPKGSRVLVTILKPMKMTIVQKNALWQGVTSSSSEPTGWSNDAFICFSAAIYSRSWRS